jgi:hypothetical protein
VQTLPSLCSQEFGKLSKNEEKECYMTLFLLILGAISAMALGALLLYKITYCFCKHLSKFLNRKKKNEHKESEYCWKPGVTEISMGDWKLSEKGKMLKIK